MAFLAFTCPEWYKLFTPLMRGSRVDPGDWARERVAWLGFLVIRAKRRMRVVGLEKVRRKPPPS